MKAPSEKHLEDWIVANPKLFGQKWAGEDAWPSDFMKDCTWFSDNSFVSPMIDSIIGRQVKFPFGIVDLIGKTSQSLKAIEIKAGTVDSGTIAQCLRYMHELRSIHCELLNDLIFNTQDEYHAHYDYPILRDLELDGHPGNEVKGVVVGHSVSDDNLLIVARLCEIKVFTYEWDGKWYWFNERFTDAYERSKDYKEYINGAIGIALRDIMKYRADWHKRDMAKRAEWERENHE